MHWQQSLSTTGGKDSTMMARAIKYIGIVFHISLLTITRDMYWSGLDTLIPLHLTSQSNVLALKPTSKQIPGEPPTSGRLQKTPCLNLLGFQAPTARMADNIFIPWCARSNSHKKILSISDQCSPHGHRLSGCFLSRLCYSWLCGQARHRFPAIGRSSV